MKKIYFICLLVMSFSWGYAQDESADEGLVYDNHVYVDYIKSVKFHIPGVVVSYPIINLGSGSLTLSFDDLDGDAKNYIYSIVHCDADWTPSDLTEMEYLDGFNEERIQETAFSFNSLTNYTHHRITLPNEDLSFTKSGNYLLKVYDDEDDRFLVLTRRFMVVDPKFIVRADVVLPSMVNKTKTHQEINFVIEHKGTRINNPRQEVNVVVMQNGRWDNALKKIQPQLIRPTSLVYELLDKVVFPAGKEFRFFDLRSLRYRGSGVKAIEEFDDGYDVTLLMDEMRAYSTYYEIRDLNGSFVIGNVDNGDRGVGFNLNTNNGSLNAGQREALEAAQVDILRQQLIQNEQSNNLQGDYANVLFSLEMNEPFYDKDVYIFGELTDWQLKQEFKMTYQNVVNAYVADVFLKQGYYNYIYATVPKKGKKIIDTSELEGNWFETENQYTILVYYRPFGARYDRLMSATTITR